MTTPSVRPLGWLQIVLLAVPCVAVMVPPVFNRFDPTLWGVPFFYWWQMLWVPLSGVFIGIAHKTWAVRNKEEAR
ncbi:MAG: DUF3311 domain-containing protein [Betaproteobacteria bacterium]|nr:DUF3311 domain-containing protein [Betaproteobacteria bacterium]